MRSRDIDWLRVHVCGQGHLRGDVLQPDRLEGLRYSNARAREVLDQMHKKVYLDGGGELVHGLLTLEFGLCSPHLPSPRLP